MSVGIQCAVYLVCTNTVNLCKRQLSFSLMKQALIDTRFIDDVIFFGDVLFFTICRTIKRAKLFVVLQGGPHLNA